MEVYILNCEFESGLVASRSARKTQFTFSILLVSKYTQKLSLDYLDKYIAYKYIL